MADVVRSEAKLVEKYVRGGDPSGWFEQLYTMADHDAGRVPWAKLEPRPLMLEWLEQEQMRGDGRRVLVVGCGLGDDAEELARRGFAVTAFDISETAVAWCQERFPNSAVDYQVADMFAPPDEWVEAFDLVLEVNIVQALPLSWRERAIAAEAQFVAPGGQLLILCMGRDDDIMEPPGPPWPMAPRELRHFEQVGLREVAFDVFEGTPVRQLRVVYERPA
ncbi:MAG: class I SAM-dependent methyltransferase [Ardenticatenaceae bacterium]